MCLHMFRIKFQIRNNDESNIFTFFIFFSANKPLESILVTWINFNPTMDE